MLGGSRGACLHPSTGEAEQCDWSALSVSFWEPSLSFIFSQGFRAGTGKPSSAEQIQSNAVTVSSYCWCLKLGLIYSSLSLNLLLVKDDLELLILLSTRENQCWGLISS